MKKLTIAALALALTACTDPDGAQKAVESYGMRDVKITGYRYFGCSEQEEQHTGFTATNAAGHQVSGVVCGNWSPFGKSNTVRID